MGWTRRDSAWHQEKRHRAVGVFGRFVLEAAVQMSEQRDWQHEERRGFVPSGSFDAEEAALHLSLLTDPEFATLIRREQILESLSAGLAACVRQGLLLPAGDAGWFIADWQTYRKDPTATKRKAAERAKKKGKRSAQAGHGDTRDSGAERAPEDDVADRSAAGEGVTVGHARHRDKPTQADGGSSPSPRAVDGHGDVRDVTLRNGTLRPPEEEERTAPTPPPPEVNARAAAAPGSDDPSGEPRHVGHRDKPDDRIRRLERELRGIDFDHGDARRREARLSLNVNVRNEVWIAEVERLLRRPRTASATAVGMVGIA